MPLPAESLTCISSQSQQNLKTKLGVKLRIWSPKHGRGCYNCKFVSLSAVRCALVLQFVSHYLHMFEWRDPERDRGNAVLYLSKSLQLNREYAFLSVQVRVSRRTALSSGIILLSNSSVQTIFLDSVAIMNAQLRRNSEIDRRVNLVHTSSRSYRRPIVEKVGLVLSHGKPHKISVPDNEENVGI